MNYWGALVGAVLTTLSYMAASIWWAASTSTTVRFLRESVDKMADNLEKRDSQFAAIAIRIDELKYEVKVLSDRVGIEEKKHSNEGGTK